MARRKPPEPPALDPELRIPSTEAALKLDDRISKGRELHSREIRETAHIEALDDEYSKWNAYNAELLGRVFTTQKLAKEYSYYGIGVISVDPSPWDRLRRIKERISDKINRLESIKERLELFPVAEGVQAAPVAATRREHTNRAFVVHGHDEAAREKVARFLDRLGIEAIILHEQATEGRTIVEKLEHYSDVDFAVVIMTPDDVGAAKGKERALQDRARQNVILELGYFVGKLGRKNVCPLYQGPLELPSDLLGVGYVPLDPGGGWHLTLARELKAAGFQIDPAALL